MDNKETTMGNEARLKVKAGVDKACDAVRPTLGPVGMTALIEYPGLDPIQCDDGVTILKNLQFEDKYENMGLQMLRKGALRTSTEGGDGTATTTVLTQALSQEAFKEVGNDSSKIREVYDRLTIGLKITLDELAKIKREVTEDDIERIATISSLDPEVSKLIAEVIKDVGIHGVVTVEKGAQLGYTKEVVKGARFERGLISPYFINDHQNKQCVLTDAYIVLADRRLSTNEQILGILTSVGTGKDILFIADDVDSVALATLSQNAINGIARIACVRNPYGASRAREFLFDIAALTGATVVSEERGMRIDDQTAAVCGRAEKVIITKDTTTIIGGQGGDELAPRIAQLQSEIASMLSSYEKGILEDRLAQLTGGIGVIRVGAYTDTEFHAKKYKFENAINATQAALQEGILPGGGTALARINHPDVMFARALTAPIWQMATNAGMNPHECTTTVQHPMCTTQSDGQVICNSSDGYDFKRKITVNMWDAGIIDPFKVVRIALESAVAIAQSLITVETAIVSVTNPDEKQQ